MTAASDKLSRAIVVFSEAFNRHASHTAQVLSDLGHDVSPAHSLDDALAHLHANPVDILVIDVASAEEKRRVVDQLADLPERARPRRVAVFADEADEYVRTLRRQEANPRVHVFLKPLHLHGLLSVLRSIDDRHLATA